MVAEPSAVERAFAIPELFDIIMLCVETTDVLRCRRVSKRFRHNIVGDKTLQERLYLAPISCDSPPVPNPLEPYCIHPIARDREDDAVQPRPSHPPISGALTAFAAKHALGTGALWTSMYVSQPPITALEIKYRIDSKFVAEHIVRRKAGIKYKDLLHEIDGMVKRYPAAPVKANDQEMPAPQPSNYRGRYAEYLEWRAVMGMKRHVQKEKESGTVAPKKGEGWIVFEGPVAEKKRRRGGKKRGAGA